MNKSSDFFYLIVLIIGVVLISANFKIDSTIGKCTSRTLHVANRWLLIISVLAIMLTFGGLTCRRTCDCSKSAIISTTTYMSALFVLGIIILTLGIIIKEETSNNSTCSEPQAQSWVNSIIITGSVILAITLAYLSKVLYSLKHSR